MYMVIVSDYSPIRMISEDMFTSVYYYRFSNFDYFGDLLSKMTLYVNKNVSTTSGCTLCPISYPTLYADLHV